MTKNIMSSLLIAAAFVAPLAAAAPASAKDGKNAAALGGLAVGVVGGAILGQALQNNDAPPPPPRPIYVQPAPRPVYVQPQPDYVEVQPRPVAVDPYYDQMSRLHMGCDQGDRRACIRFGIMIGQHQDREAMWRRSHPEMFNDY